MRILPLVLLTALLAGCSNPPPGPSTTQTMTQDPEPSLHWVYVNRTLTISGTNGGARGEGFQALPGNANCAYFHHAEDAGLTALTVTAEGENPSTVQAWDLTADFPDAGNYTAPTVTGLLPLTLNLTDLNVEGQDAFYFYLETARSAPGSTAIQSQANLSIRLLVNNPDALGIEDSVRTCTT